MANRTIDLFLDDPDQAARRDELLAFVGPRPEGFLDLYDHMVETHTKDATKRRGRRVFYNGFSAYSFFFGPVYFFYRKMWFWGGAFTLASLLFTVIPFSEHVNIYFAIGVAFSTRWVYLLHAIGEITNLRAKAGDDRQAFLHALSQAGGVSKTAAWISGTLFVLALIFAVVQAFS